jgi:beta-mannosidase
MSAPNGSRSVDLTGGWTVTAVDGPFPAELQGRVVPAAVPGVVHIDLLASDLIPDPFLDDNAERLSWIGRTSWRYATVFEWDGASADQHVLVFDGLDTIATVTLNGRELGRTFNQHRSYRFDVTDRLEAGRNELLVTFGSALEHAEEVDRRNPRPHVNPHPFNAIRKAACNFGWDWGPDLVTAGIWRPVRLESWSTGRLGTVRPLVVEASEEHAAVEFRVPVERTTARPPKHLQLLARLAGQEVMIDLSPGATEAAVRVDVPDPELWWPVGYGEQPLYEAEVELLSQDQVLHRWSGRIGLRSITVDTTRDAAGHAFGLQVNGKDVFVRGVNWIPDDVFVPRLTRKRYQERIEQAVDAGSNLLRVWGGGIYESTDFYELCDQRGVLVWQDFGFACATYAEEELAEEVEAEARENVARLARHPSLVLWNGSNENLWLSLSLGWRAEVGSASWGEGFYYHLLPEVVADLDPTRPYVPSSPFSPSTDRYPNDPDDGPIHIWDVWNEVDYREYARYRPRFVSEFGFQGPPNWATLTRAISLEHRTVGSPVLLTHQKAEGGDEKLTRGWSGHFPDPVGLDDWHWTAQLNQARAITFAVERFRSQAPHCRGTILWQLNDCWPVVSWAAVDGDGRLKPLWYALRAAYADRLLTFQLDEPEGAVLAFVNDSDTPYSGSVVVSRRDFEGNVLDEHQVELDVAARAVQRVRLPASVCAPADRTAELLVADVLDGDPVPRALGYFAEDVELALPQASYGVVVEPSDDSVVVEVTARTLLRDLTLLTDRLAPDAVVDEQLVTLLPGETKRLRVHLPSGGEVSPAALTAPVLRTANDLVAGPPLSGHAN